MMSLETHQRSLRVFASVISCVILCTLFMATMSSAQERPARTVFVHLFEWKWTDIANECEQFLGPKGYAAVQISPPNEHAEITDPLYPWWQSYQPVSYKLDSRRGTRAEFVDMVQRCHAAGVDIYADAVVNHMTGWVPPDTEMTGIAGSTFYHYSYPADPPEYSYSHFHHINSSDNCVINNYDDGDNVRKCELAGSPTDAHGLVDLKTEDGVVQQKIADYMNDLLNIGVGGFRIDAAKHMYPADIAGIISRLNQDPGDYFLFQEVIDKDNDQPVSEQEAVDVSEYYGNGNVTEFMYGKKLATAFKDSGKLGWLSNFGEEWQLMPSYKAIVFTDNHDNQRGHGGGGVLTYKDNTNDSNTYTLANIFMLAWPYGYPKVMSSYDWAHANSDDTTNDWVGPPSDTNGNTNSIYDANQNNVGCFAPRSGPDSNIGATGGWMCEHRWREIANMVDFRNFTVNSWGIDHWWSDDPNGQGNQIAFARVAEGQQGQPGAATGFVVLNKEWSGLDQWLQTGMPAGDYCNIIAADYDPNTGNCALSPDHASEQAVITVHDDGKAHFVVGQRYAAAIHVGATVVEEEQMTVSKLGVDYSPEQTTFAIWSPDTSDVVLNLDGTDYPCQRAVDFDGYTKIYGVTIPGDHKLKEYQFKINGVAVRDPYGTMVKPGTNINIVMDVDSIVPMGGWVARPALTEREDAVIYEVHVRDFTLDSTSGVPDDKKGKFLGMVETGTTYNGVTTGIDHLKELGVTHVQILPFYDFATSMYNWGYDPVNYNVPEEQYSMTPYDYENRVRELQTMVNEFHRNGIRVIMDVVYNHTYADEMFENITDQYYTGNDDSGCGNGVDTSVPMVSRMIRDSLEYLLDTYNIDGFRFDLVGIFHYDEYRKWGEYLNQRFPDRNILMYGEPWNGYMPDPEEHLKVRLGNAPAIASGNVGVFNSKFREAVKGDSDGTGKGYMFNATDNAWNVKVGSRGSIMYTKSPEPLSDMWDPMFAYDPEQSMNYLSAHDNYCLWDKIKHVGEHNEYGKRVLRFGMGIILTSQGIPFIHAGDEMLRTKMYDAECTELAHNTYNAPDKCNVIRWNWKIENADVYEYHKDLIALRKAHPGFRLNTWDEINSWMSSYTDDKVVVNQINADQNGDEWDEILVVYNPGDTYNVSLPAGTWAKVFDISGAVNVPDLSGSAAVEGTAVTVFAKTGGSGEDWQRTVVYMYGQTQTGQDMFILGGIDHNYAASIGRDCTNTNYECAIPIQHLNLRNATTAPWKQGDNYLDWYGAESGQDSNSSGSPLDWTTTASDSHPNSYDVDGYGRDDENLWGAHYWKFEVEMDCSKTVNGWFELKSFISNGPGWEGDVSQSGTPYQSGNHFARCGQLNVFQRGVSEPVTIEPLP